MRALAGAVILMVGCGAGGGTLAGAGGSRGMGTGIGGLGGLSTWDCAMVTVPPRELAPDVLIALDTSSSMNDDLSSATCVGGCGQTSKWAATAAAINSVVASTASRVNWGIELFANKDVNLCGASPGVFADNSPVSAVAIDAALQHLTNPSGGVYGAATRQTRGAVEVARTRLMARPDPNAKFIVIVTDGAPMCAPDGIAVADDTAATVDAITAAAAAGVPSFVIGIAVGVGPAATSLIDMGNAGAWPGGGAFTTSTATDISATLSAVANQTMGCTFEVPPEAPDGTQSRDQIAVIVDGREIPHDPRLGWDYVDATHASVRLRGAACVALRESDQPLVTIVFRCLVGV